MEYKNSQELMEKMARRSDGVCLLAFSRGKDAICAWIELRKYFTEIHPVYYYNIPDLQFVEDSLKYYEDYFQTKIARLPNPHLYRMLNNQVYQTPGNIKVLKEFPFPGVLREHLCEAYKEDHRINPNAYVAIGNRMYDNMMRYRAIKKFGAVNDKIKTFFPVYDYRIADVLASIKSTDVKLPVDYYLWGKTFDGFDYRFIKPLIKYYPADYEKIKTFFPLLDLEIMRYEQL